MNDQKETIAVLKQLRQEIKQIKKMPVK